MVPFDPLAFHLRSTYFHETLINENFLLVATFRNEIGLSTITRKKLEPNSVLIRSLFIIFGLSSTVIIISIASSPTVCYLSLLGLAFAPLCGSSSRRVPGFPAGTYAQDTVPPFLAPFLRKAVPPFLKIASLGQQLHC